MVQYQFKMRIITFTMIQVWMVLSSGLSFRGWVMIISNSRHKDTTVLLLLVETTSWKNKNKNIIVIRHDKPLSFRAVNQTLNICCFLPHSDSPCSFYAGPPGREARASERGQAAVSAALNSGGRQEESWSRRPPGGASPAERAPCRSYHIGWQWQARGQEEPRVVIHSWSTGLCSSTLVISVWIQR